MTIGPALQRIGLAFALVAAACGSVEGRPLKEPVPPPGKASADHARAAASFSVRAAPLASVPARQAFPAPSRMPARYLRSLEYSASGYSAQTGPGGSGVASADSDLLLGDLLFHSSHTLGPRAQQLGVSCQTCHPNGASHVDLVIEPASDPPGNVDLSSTLFRSGADDGIDNPLNIPSLRGCRYTAPYGHDGSVASLSQFIAHVVTSEFSGRPLDPHELGALTRYLLDLDFLPNANLDDKNELTARTSPAAQRGGLVFRAPRAGFHGKSCASCHPASSFFRDGLSHRLGTGHPPSPHALDGGYETPTLLGLAETAPYFHDGRFEDLAKVVAWFDQSFVLGLSEREQSDLVAYLTAVGAVDRPGDDRPLAQKLDHVFAYATLLSASASRRVWIATLDAIAGELQHEPASLADRVRELNGRLRGWRRAVISGEPLAPLAEQAAPLRGLLARLAADWAGALAP